MSDNVIFDKLNEILRVSLRDPERPAWIMLSLYGIGETAIFCAFAEAFLKEHGHAVTMVLTPKLAPVAQFYQHRFHRILVASDEIIATFLKSGFIKHDRFDLDYPMEAHTSGFGFEFSDGISHLFKWPGRGGISAIDLARFVFRLPWNSRLERPTIPPEWELEAKSYANKVGLIPGRSVVLFPLNNTCPMYSLDFWNGVADRLIKNGYKVFSNGLGLIPGRGREPLVINGAVPIDLPIQLGLSFCKLAGRVIIGSNGMQCFMTMLASKDIDITVLLAVPSKIPPAAINFSRGMADHPLNSVPSSQSMQYQFPEAALQIKSNEFVVPFDAGPDELAHLAKVVADNDASDAACFKRYETNGKLFLEEHAHWLRELF
ncbi:MAG: hypothetical protein EPN21_05780 [Methylococcaceae bacterium]|nr:MAG: hypothetical protein EPN21_05780 [Methylococcaceae bacterium]